MTLWAQKATDCGSNMGRKRGCGLPRSFSSLMVCLGVFFFATLRRINH
jgi:hypothetical protein